MYIYYVYWYLRKDGTPYYIGKGKGRRMYEKHNVHLPADKSKIRVIAQNLSEPEALILETKLIKEFGRKDLNTGILRNLTNGGDGTSGYKHTEEWKQNNSKRMIGENNVWYGVTGTNHPLYGKPKSPESRENYRKASSGEKNRMFGKLGKDNPNFGSKRTAEQRANMTKANRTKATDEVILEALKLLELKTHSQREIAKILGVGEVTISNIKHGKLLPVLSVEHRT